MKAKIGIIILGVLLAVGMFPKEVYAAKNTEDIVILYENDVHGAVEGYSKLAAMKKELQESYDYVGVLSCGDYLQGSSLCSVSRGEYIVNLMNLVGYDAVALGNHEFDYRLTRLEELMGMMDTQPICCNFQSLQEEQAYFEPYSMVSYGDVDIAYIGITTPSTLTSSSPAQFKDDKGEFLYTFQTSTLYDVVQDTIDQAKSAGAEYIVALSHIGFAEDETYADLDDIKDLIQNTDGFDVVLDAHSHTVIEGELITDKGGNDVLLSSTGTKFEYIGKLILTDGTCKTQLIKTEDYQKTDADVDAYIQQIYEEYAVLGDRKVAFSEVDLVTQDPDGNRLVRKAETNLGDLCAEAIRSAVNADIGYINGGGIRADILKGDITYNDLLGVFPFNNTIVLAQVSGQTIKDMMEMAMMIWPEENGSFPHLSGITFSVNTEIASSVTLDETEEFTGVGGPYRVYNIEVFNSEKKKYEPLELTKTYTIASHNYALLEYGSGMAMLKEAQILKNDGLLDVEALERYIVEDLGGVVGELYQDTTVNITFTEGEIQEANTMVVVYVIIGLVIAGIVVFLLLKRRKSK